MSDTQATFFATLIDEWARAGVQHAVVAPGNRSSLLSALLLRDGRIEVHPVVDERSGSFFALGIGKATGKPAVFGCTSGTATAEVHAAVVEADQGGVPLLVCTADRPPELHHVRDWQSIEQTNLYGSSPRWSFSAEVANDDASGSWRSIASRAVLETTQNPSGPGPVHLNLPIREPWSVDPGLLPDGRPGGNPWHIGVGSGSFSSMALSAVISQAGKRGVIVAGSGDLDPIAVHRAAKALGWPVLAEARSGCRIDRSTGIAIFDALVSNERFASENKPEVVLRFGTPPISKSLSTFLNKSDAYEIVVDEHNHWVGARADANIIVTAEPNQLCDAIADAAPAAAPSTWLSAWRSAQDRAELAVLSYLETRETEGGGLCEPAIARAVASTDTAVFAATSMPVRDIEAFAPRGCPAIYANRGASGMDGIVSCAAGVSVGLGEHVTLLTGDLTFLYDLNAQWLFANHREVDLNVVLMDNNGGGIFSMLPQLKDLESDDFEKVVATPHNIDIAAVVTALGVECITVSSISELNAALSKRGGLRVIYAKTDRGENAKVHRDIKSAVRQVLR